MFGVTKKGRTYVRGKALTTELRIALIDEIMSRGGDMATGNFPGSFNDIANQFKLCSDTVRKIWNQVCLQGSVEPKKSQTGNVAHLKEEDIQLIELLKREKASCNYSTILEEVNNCCVVDGGTSVSAIGRAVRTRMSDGPWTHKKLAKHCQDKFTRPGNVAYAQQFLNFLHNVPANKVKFFDEAGVNVGVGNPTYGHSLIGTPAVEILAGNTKGANYTLNLLCGLDGVLYANTIAGGANTIDFLNFWGEAIDHTAPSGLPVLDNGDVFVYDNAQTHRHDAGEALATWFMDMGMASVYTPVRSPEFNAAELVFNKLKTVLKQEEYANLLRVNVPAAIYAALPCITEDDMIGFYRHLQYLRI